jgi:three-Cys-motif partner protein
MGKRRQFELTAEPDPCPELEVELGPGGDGVGAWIPTEKHTRLAKYVRATWGARAKLPSRVFIDPFCGSGRIQVRGEAGTRDGGALVAWRQALLNRAPFSRMLVGDLLPARSAACAARLAALQAPVERFTGPAVDTVRKMVARVPSGSLTLAYLDPYNLEALSFEIIRTLSTLRKVDLLVHFSRMDLHRNVDMELDAKRARFDEAAPDWREHLARVAKPQLPGAFFEYWQSKVRGLGFSVSAEMPLVTADNGAPLYRLVFFSRHELPNRIWGDVARGPNRELF